MISLETESKRFWHSLRVRAFAPDISVRRRCSWMGWQTCFRTLRSRRASRSRQRNASCLRRIGMRSRTALPGSIRGMSFVPQQTGRQMTSVCESG
jgi:hypothetical protein